MSTGMTTLAKSLGIFLSGDHLNTRDEHGEKIIDDSFYIIFNSAEISVIFTIPDKAWGESWIKIHGYIRWIS